MIRYSDVANTAKPIHIAQYVATNIHHTATDPVRRIFRKTPSTGTAVVDIITSDISTHIANVELGLT